MTKVADFVEKMKKHVKILIENVRQSYILLLMGLIVASIEK